MSACRSARLLAAGLALAAAAGTLAPTAGAQQQPAAPTVERPAAFDSAGRLLLVTPALAARLRLGPPAFPVQGPFTEARLFAAPDAAAAGPAVLSVVRVGGAVERYPLAAAERAALVAAVTAGLAAGGSDLRSDTAVVSQPAGRAFVRNQTALGLFVYGPATAVLLGSDDGAGATLGYAAGAGAAFAVALATSQRQTVTRAQATLSGSMGLGGAIAAPATLAVLASPDGDRGYAAAALLGGVGGSILGFRRAAGMTDAEASASSAAAFLGAATSVGLATALDAYANEGTGRATGGANIAALAAGYALGPRYARTRRYHVTAGDVEILTPAATTGALLGAAVGAAINSDNRGSGYARAPWVGATAGLVAGTVLGDRLLVRRLDHTSAEADLAGLGTSVGGALGFALAASADVNSAAGYLTAGGIGALAGLAFSEAVLKPGPDAGPRRLRSSFVPPVLQPGRLRVSPSGLALARLTAARGGRGTFPVLSLTF
jgi:hypothetical protein